MVWTVFINCSIQLSYFSLNFTLQIHTCIHTYIHTHTHTHTQYTNTIPNLSAGIDWHSKEPHKSPPQLDLFIEMAPSPSQDLSRCKILPDLSIEEKTHFMSFEKLVLHYEKDQQIDQNEIGNLAMSIKNRDSRLTMTSTNRVVCPDCNMFYRNVSSIWT